MRQIPYGEANFEKIREENWLYVDKTMYIPKLEANPDRRKTIYLRPRRFGKSLFASMLTAYYSVDTENKFEKLFKGLYIYENPTQNKNNYYVLNFNFSGLTIVGKDIVEEGKNEFCEKVRIGIKDFINRYELNLKATGESAASLLSNLITDFDGLNLENKMYIIIDEYDNFTNAILKDEAKDFLDLVNRNGYVRAFYEVIKEKLEKGIVDRFFATGVMPVTLDNLTSGFNIATNLSTDMDFTSMVGFSHEEVDGILKELLPPEKVDEVYAELEANYDGYRFSVNSEEKTFNSTLVLYYLKNYIRLNTAPDELIDMNMNINGEKIKRIVELVDPKNNYEAVEKILLKNKISGQLKGVVLNEEYDTNDLITMLFYLGYITIDSRDVETNFKIPNYVTATVFSDYFSKVINANKEYEIETRDISGAIMELAKTGNIVPTANLVQKFLYHSSVRDMENFSEKNLKYIFTMFLSLSKQYMVYGEFPAGQGFADIMVQKTSSSTARYEAVIELKYVSKKESKRINKKKLVKEAKNQLERYMTDKRLKERANLKKYVIAFLGFEEVYVEEI